MPETALKTWFHERRHIEKIEGEVENCINEKEEWRKIKDRMKTISVALVLCLNVGVDPPDVIKPLICARREAWVDPALMNPLKVPQKVAQMLQKSYERLQPRARYKAAIDPTIDYLKKLCSGLRRSAKEERVLFHYNGHGVPRPTENGEIWVFNKQITQYIPLSLYDLQSYMETPSVYVWDTHNAGLIIKKFLEFSKVRNTEKFDNSKVRSDENIKLPNFSECIHMAACEEDELLPTDPNLPADLFTSCLTTPIQTSMLWYVLKTNTKDRYPLQMIEALPGNLTDRKSVLGELNWIFTAITDTIAWDRLSPDLFQKLFRQDLLVASLFRSFLLAEKIMRDHGCKVTSHPKLTPVYDHPLWDYWEYAIELCLIHLYNKEHASPLTLHLSQVNCFTNTTTTFHSLLVEFEGPLMTDDNVFNAFFIEQLQAFDIWLRFDIAKESPPDQLPVVLQVLLSQVHRVKALELLAKFLDIGAWAVKEALFVGVFPYVLKLLQSGTRELRPSLTFIWAKILIVDAKCSEDLLCDENYLYFIDIIKDKTVLPRFKIIPVFVLCTLMKHHLKLAQRKFFTADLLETAVELISQPEVTTCKMLCVWLLICLGKLWNNYEEARWRAVRNIGYDTVVQYLTDDVPEVRAAAVYALGQLMSNRSLNNDHAMTINSDIIDKIVASCAWDGSVLVRLELAVAIQWYILDHERTFAELCIELDKRLNYETQKSHDSITSLNGSTIFNSPVCIPNGRRTISTCSQYSDYNGTQNLDATSNGKEQIRDHLYKQWKILEAKLFSSPYERVWIVVLRLYFDPMKQVRDLATKLVKHVVDKAEKITKSLVNDLPRATFRIGSPDNVELIEKPKRKLPMNEGMKTSPSNADLNKMNNPETSSTTLFEKRMIHGPRSSESKRTKSTTENLNDLQPILNTQFVEWSGKIFNKRIYRTLYEEGESDSRDWMVDGQTCFTRLIPSDWALHTAEGLEQHAKADVEKIRSNKANFQSTPLAFPFHHNRRIYCIEWSYLRPYVYLCDGRNVYAYNTQNRSKQCEPSFQITVNDDPLFEDPLTDVLLVNEQNHELMIMGTRDGLISVWDPKFNVHGHHVEGNPKMLTSNFIFNDQTRVFMNQPTNGKKTSKMNANADIRSNHTLYQWDQGSGHLLCGGNVRIARIWDAWAEKKKIDFELPQKNGITSSLCADSKQELVAVGFDTGALNVFDVRLDSPVMSIPSGARSRIVGTSFLGDSSLLTVGYHNGIVKVYDPRQFEEPLQEIDFAFQHIEIPKVTSSPLMLFSGNNNIQPRKLTFELKMHKMVAQKSNNIIGCALNDGTVRLFDVSGSEHKSFGHIYYPNLTVPSFQSNLNAIKFHSRRGQLAVVTGIRSGIKLKPETVPLKKALKIAVIGSPNVGKSAITNAIIKADLCAVSKRMDTTRFNTITAITENSCQLVVVDSPGLVGIQHARNVARAHNESALLTDPEKAIEKADHILVVHDATLPGKYIHHRVLHLLHRFNHLSSSLIINKTDLIARQADLLELANVLTCGKVDGQEIGTKTVKMGKLGQVQKEMKLHSGLENKSEKIQQTYHKLMQKPIYKCSWGETQRVFADEYGWPNFDKIFFASAVTGRGIDELRNHLRSLSVPTEEFYMDESEMTKKKPRQICAEHVRSEILNVVPTDIAYNLRVNVIEWSLEEREDDIPLLKIVVDVNCDERRWADILFQAIPEIEARTKEHMRNVFLADPEIRIRSKFRKQVIG